VPLRNYSLTHAGGSTLRSSTWKSENIARRSRVPPVWCVGIHAASCSWTETGHWDALHWRPRDLQHALSDHHHQQQGIHAQLMSQVYWTALQRKWMSPNWARPVNWQQQPWWITRREHSAQCLKRLHQRYFYSRWLKERTVARLMCADRVDDNKVGRRRFMQTDVIAGAVTGLCQNSSLSERARPASSSWLPHARQLSYWPATERSAIPRADVVIVR